MLTEYEIGAIRDLLKAAFTAQDLWRFCQERPAFQPVLLHFPLNATPAQMIDALTESCRTQALFDDLLAEIRLTNPRQYEQYQTQCAAGNAALAPGLRIPHNLPPRIEFVGREKEKARIHEALRSRYLLISIEGIGKTSLALEATYQCLQASQSNDPPAGTATFHSFVWVTAKDRDLTLNALLDAIALTLDYPGIVQKPLKQKRFAVEKLLRERPCLLLVDNLETVTDEGVWDLLRGLPEPSKALSTTREQKLSQVWSIPLKELEESESLALIRSEGRHLDLQSIAHADDKALLHLHQTTRGAPRCSRRPAGLSSRRPAGRQASGSMAASWR